MSERLYHRRFSAMRGVDLSGGADGASLDHFAELCNMWASPTPSVACVETVPGARACHRFTGAILGIWHHRTKEGDHLVVHAGEALYRFPVSLRDRPRSLAALAPIRTGLADERGCAFAVEDRLYLLIGGAYLMIAADGRVCSLEESGGYIPLAYLNGQAYEQRNLLTDRVRMAYTAEEGLYGTAVGAEGLCFSVLDRERSTCSVRIADESRNAGAVSVPAYADIGGQNYTVVAVDTEGFADMRALCRLSLPETLVKIGARAFHGCSALQALSLPSGTTEIGYQAFGNCLTLKSVHLGSSLARVAAPLFTGCVCLEEVAFGGTSERLAAIEYLLEEKSLCPEGIEVTLSAYVAPSRAVLLRLPAAEPLASLDRVTLGDYALGTDFTPIGNTFARYSILQEEGHVTGVEVSILDDTLSEGRQIVLHGRLSPAVFARSGDEEIGGREAILGCRLCATYDGRVFLSGNPSLPNTLFYSSFGEGGRCEPFYFGLLDYVNDGEGSAENRALLPVGSALAVIKQDGASGCGVYFHTPQDTGEHLVPRVYPTVQGANGIGTVGGAISFRDDPVFLSSNGLYAITKQASNLERSLLCRSSRIDPALCAEPPKEVRCAVALGYLFLLVDGSLYLADSRQLTVGPLGHYEYEWYPLFGFGSYTADRPIYRYAPLPDCLREEGVYQAEEIGAIAEGEIFSRATEHGMIYYTADRHLLVDSDGERTGGVFSPVSELCAVGDLVFFGTGDGTLLCFNSDRRGISLYRAVGDDRYVRTEKGYLPLAREGGSLVDGDTVETAALYRLTADGYLATGEYAEVFTDGDYAVRVTPIDESARPNEIAPHRYSVMGHGYPSFCTLAMENGGLPHYTKNTEPRSVTAKVKSFPYGGFSLAYRTDRHPWRAADARAVGGSDFGCLDFGCFDFHNGDTVILALREKARGWCEKQYRLASAEHGRPFGLCHLAYSYRIAGRPKE